MILMIAALKSLVKNEKNKSQDRQNDARGQKLRNKNDKKQNKKKSFLDAQPFLIVTRSIVL